MQLQYMFVLLQQPNDPRCKTTLPKSYKCQDAKTQRRRCYDNYLLIMSVFIAIICSACDCNAISVELSHAAVLVVVLFDRCDAITPLLMCPIIRALVGQLWHLGLQRIIAEFRDNCSSSSEHIIWTCRRSRRQLLGSSNSR